MKAAANPGPGWVRSGGAGRDRWMASYMDVVTILLILFVAVAAQTPAAGARQKAQPARPAAGPLIRAQEFLNSKGLESHLERRGLVIALPQTILFASGEDRVSETALPVIGRVAAALHAIPNRILLVGHADAVPIHNRRFRSNWELSAARSMRLMELFTAQFGIAESRLIVASYGSQGPRGPNDTADGRAENRRVEIVILGDSVEEAFR
jgi:chemotaxis protein MotB